MEKRWKMEFLNQNGDEDNPSGAWGVYDTLNPDFGTETFARLEDAHSFMYEKNIQHEENKQAIDDLKKFIEEHQDDDGISDRDRRANYLYDSGYGDRVGLDSFAYDSRGNDTGLRESDFI